MVLIESVFMNIILRESFPEDLHIVKSRSQSTRVPCPADRETQG